MKFLASRNPIDKTFLVVSLEISAGFPSSVAVKFINLKSYLSLIKKEINILSYLLFKYPLRTVYLTPSI